MKRIRLVIPKESAARSQGLIKKERMAAGFDCECGVHHPFSAYVCAHWDERLEHTCSKCKRVHTMRKGVVKLKEQIKPKPPKKVRSLGIDPATDPDAQQEKWCAYHVMHSIGRPTIYRRITAYHAELDQCNDEAWTYALAQEPYSQSKAKEFYGFLLKRKEYPKLSQVATGLLTVGGGTFLDCGIDEGVHWLKLQAPDGQQTEIRLNAADYRKAIEGWAKILGI